MASLEFEGVSKVYDASVWAVRDLNLEVHDGEFAVLVGPSGCGKTTALRMLAGFETATAGDIRIAGQSVNGVLPRDRDIAMVFQNYALYPHKTVYDNIAYGLRVRGVPKAQRAERIQRVAAMLALTDVLKRKPGQLSGGQRQRVAMGRAIVRQPRAFLMDEPLSNLDARLRVRMRTEIASLQRELGVTTVYVTHDQVEAMTMADRVAVLRRGVLQQFDTPQRVYSSPSNLFVASFMGSPAMNLLRGRLEQQQDGVHCRIGSHSLAVPEQLLADEPALARAIGRDIAVGIRPNAIEVTPGNGNGLPGVVIASEELGSEVIVHVEAEASPVVHEDVTEGLPDDILAPVVGPSDRAESTLIVAQLPADTVIHRSQPVTLRLQPSRMHFFDLETGLNLRSSGDRTAVAEQMSFRPQAAERALVEP
jgi:multiple sugar transport system ATP-binding protein